MKVSNQTAAQVSEVFSEIVKKYPSDSDNKIMSDLSIQVKQDSGELTVYDDDDEEITSCIMEEWVDYKEDNFYEMVRETLRQCIMDHQEELESLSLLRPYSFILVDDEKETISELYLVDDNTIIIENEELMKGL